MFDHVVAKATVEEHVRRGGDVGHYRGVGDVIRAERRRTVRSAVSRIVTRVTTRRRVPTPPPHVGVTRVGS